MKKILKDYKSFFESWKVNEADAGFKASESNEMLDQANIKIRRAIVWININKSFYANLLQYVNIYGTMDLNPKTMATDGESIMFHPEFVLEQTDAAIRFVLCHEILHCINEHHERRGKRNPVGWNIACDYAINPILDGEEGFEWPKINGKQIGLYEERFAGMNAEDIYDILKQESRINPMGVPQKGQEKSVDTILDQDDSKPKPSGPMVQQGQFDDEDEQEEDDKENNEEGQKKECSCKKPECKKCQGGQKKGGDGKDGKDDKDVEDGKKGSTGKPSSDTSKKSDKEGEKNELPSIGDKVRLRDGKEAVVKAVYPDGSIEV